MEHHPLVEVLIQEVTWCQVFHTRDATHRWTCTLDMWGWFYHRWKLPGFSHESMGSVENGPRKNERNRSYWRYNPFSFHGFHERFPWIHGRKVVVISYGKVSRTVLTEVYYVYSSFTLKADGTQSDDPASETGSHLMDSGGEAGLNFQGPVYFLY